VELGTDTLSDKVLSTMRKEFTATMTMTYSQRLSQAGIKQCHNLIFGGPGETQFSLDFNMMELG